MVAIEDVLSDLKKQRRSWDEFKAAQDARLSIAEKEIRALFMKAGGPAFIFCVSPSSNSKTEG